MQKLQRWFGVSVATILAFGCAVDPESGSVRQFIEAQAPSQSDQVKRDLALNVIERFVPFAEGFWKASDLKEAQSGRYDAVGSGVTQPRGAGDIAFAYVTLLAARPDQATFGGIPRETLIDHTIQSIRHEALTNALSGAGYNRWGKGSWQASLETAGWAFAAQQLWDRLDQDTRDLVQRVVTGEANLLLTKAIASGEEGDTGAEDNAWNSTTPALAAVMFPEDPNRAAWETTAQRLAMNASSTRADQSSAVLVDGQPVSNWMASVNLHPDFTMENHGFFNPIYQQVAHVDIGEAAIAYGQAGHPLPEAFSFRTETVWDEILARLATDDGDFALTAGQDWTSKDYQHLDYLAILATRFQRADASVYESRALAIVAKRQATHPNGSLLGQSQVGYETMLVKRMASVWWNHHLFGPSPEPTAAAFEAARAPARGAKVFPYSDFIAARLGKAFVSMSWDPTRPLALVVPNGEATLDDPILSYYAPKNLLGGITGTVGPHSSFAAADRFSSAGSIGTRRLALTAFADGTTVLLDRGEGSTFTYALEDIPGLLGERPIWSAAGVGLGALPGSWVNAADRLGFIVRGCPGVSAAAVAGTNNQVVITGCTDTGSGNRGAVLLPLSSHSETAALEPYALQLATPDQWSALVARAADGSGRLAVARWGGRANAELTLPDERGAPVPEQDATLSGNEAQFPLFLEAPSSRGQTLRFFVQSTAGLKAHQESEQVALIRNPGAAPTLATVSFQPSSGALLTASRSLAAGQEVRARVVAGALTLAGPELESLQVAKTSLAGLQEQVEGWRACHVLGPVQALALSALVRGALSATEQALAEAEAVTPNDRRAGAAVILASKATELLAAAARLPRLPATVSASVTTVAAVAGQQLKNATQQAYVLSARIEPVSLAQPGEPLRLRLTWLNRGVRPATQGSWKVVVPEGWVAPSATPAFTNLAPGETQTAELALPVPANQLPGESASLGVELTYQEGGQTHTQSASTAVTVAPVLDMVPKIPLLPLARGGVQSESLELTNYADHEISVRLSSPGLVGVSLLPEEQELIVPASGTLTAQFLLSGTSLTSGSAILPLLATTSQSAQIPASVELRFFDDLARNGLGAPWPLGTASSNQSAYPASLAFDGLSTTFWVSAGTMAGEGPSASNPQFLSVDLGQPVSIGSISMVPRVNYGPKAYSIETSDDGLIWTPVVDIPAAPNAAATTAFAPVITRRIRLRITDGWDKTRPPRNVQVVALEVRPPV